ncbi:MAG: hypothetical protein ABIJ91_02020 [Candidatus Kuenenbacteria bacterium]
MSLRIKKTLIIFIPCLLISLVLIFYFVNNNSFNKKTKCAELRNEIEKEFEEELQAQIYHEYKTFKEIFYSPKQNSCLYSYFKTTFNSPFEEKDVVFSYVLADALTNNIIVELKSPDILADSKNETERKFNIEVKKFK